MIFNSLTFLVFITLFFPLYFGTKGRLRIWVSLLASYLFLRLVGLAIFVPDPVSTIMDWWFGMWISYLDNPADVRAQSARGSRTLQFFSAITSKISSLGWNRKSVLVLSMVMNLGFLGVFKYFNFFAENFANLIRALGLTPSWTTLHIILPVGISFYTFRACRTPSTCTASN